VHPDGRDTGEQDALAPLDLATDGGDLSPREGAVGAVDVTAGEKSLPERQRKPKAELPEPRMTRSDPHAAGDLQR
jgi:hypothetical protein